MAQTNKDWVTRAHQLVHIAVKNGRLPRLNGSILCKREGCTKPARHYDHRNYYEPLNVQPLCQSCNRLVEPGLGHETFSYRIRKKIMLGIWDRFTINWTTSEELAMATRFREVVGYGNVNK